MSENSAEHIRPDLLFGTKKEMTRRDILEAVPQRATADRLVSNWFSEVDVQPGWYSQLE